NRTWPRLSTGVVASAGGTIMHSSWPGRLGSPGTSVYPRTWAQKTDWAYASRASNVVWEIRDVMRATLPRPRRAGTGFSSQTGRRGRIDEARRVDRGGRRPGPARGRDRRHAGRPARRAGHVARDDVRESGTAPSDLAPPGIDDPAALDGALD